MPAHKGETRKFDELTFSEQAKSITAMINNLSRAIRSHVRSAENPGETKKKCVLQIYRFLGRHLE